MTKLEMLKEPYWNNVMIQNYFNVSNKVASQIRQKAINEFDGMSNLFVSKTKRDSIFQALGLNALEELEIIKKCKEVENYANS